MDFIYCGIKFKSPRNFERIRVDNVNFNENSAALKERVKNEILDKTKDEISLVYCGNILEDDEPIKKYVLHSGSTVHVLRKSPEEQIKEVPAKFTELDVSSVCSLYRALNSGNFHVSFLFFFLCEKIRRKFIFVSSHLFVCHRKSRGRK